MNIYLVFLCVYLTLVLIIVIIIIIIIIIIIPYFKYTPANVLENENLKLYWNRSILTDKTIPFNRHDITFMNKKTKNTF